MTSPPPSDRPDVCSPVHTPDLRLVSPTAGSLPLPADVTAAHHARRWADDEVRRLGVTDARVRDDLALVVSELVSNAVQHGAPPVRLTLSYDIPDLLVAVSDGGGPPYLVGSHRPDPTSHHGRGMSIVAALGTAWGTRAARPGPGKTIWCRLRTTGPAPPG